MIFISKSPAQTKQFAAKLAKKIVSSQPGHRATVVALEGELGAGKTTFTQGFVRALGIREKVKSPTFLLMKTYPLTVPIAKRSRILDKVGTKNYRLLYHIDCYRIKNAKELEPLEIKSILKDPQAIVLIEWPERITKILPKQRVIIHLDHLSVKERRIKVS